MKEWIAMLIAYCWTIPLCIYFYNRSPEEETKADRFTFNIFLGAGGYVITNLLLTILGIV